MATILELNGIRITDEYLCDGSEYKTNPHMIGCMQYSEDFTIVDEITYRVSDRENPNEFMALFVNETSQGSGLYVVTNGGGSLFYPEGTPNEAKLPRIEYNDAGYYPPQIGITDAVGGGDSAFISTNFPIFLTKEDAQQYIYDGTGLARAINYTTPSEPDGEEFEITNIGTTGTFSEFGASIGEDRYYRNVKGKIVNGKLAVYPIPGIDDGTLKYGVKLLGELYGCTYSVDGVTWQDTDTFPFDFFYRERDKEIGTFKFALTFSEISTPIFSDEEKAEDYVNDRIGIEESENWNEISRYYPDVVNGTGVSDDTTEFGEVYTKAFFSQQYICSTDAIQEISNGLYDVSEGGFFEKIKKGVEMFGNNPIDSVFSLVYYPFNLNQIFHNTSSQNYVYFGGYKYDLSHAVNKIIYPNGYLDLGTFNLKPTFKNYRDYEPYSKLRVYLPYIGWHQLDIKRYIGKSVKVRYYIDTRTNGTCTACLIVNNLLTDYFVGQIGVQFPMTLTDFSSYSNSQIATLLGGASGVVGDVTGGVSGVVGNERGAMPMPGMSALSIASAEIGVAGSIGKSVYQLGQNNINNYNATKGCSTSLMNQYLPQEVLFEFEMQEIDETKNAPSLRGYPSNASGTLNNFSGYLEIQEIDLICPGATESEKSELITLLNNGVRI